MTIMSFEQALLIQSEIVSGALVTYKDDPLCTVCENEATKTFYKIGKCAYPAIAPYMMSIFHNEKAALESIEALGIQGPKRFEAGSFYMNEKGQVFKNQENAPQAITFISTSKVTGISPSELLDEKRNIDPEVREKLLKDSVLSSLSVAMRLKNKDLNINGVFVCPQQGAKYIDFGATDMFDVEKEKTVGDWFLENHQDKRWYMRQKVKIFRTELEGMLTQDAAMLEHSRSKLSAVRYNMFSKRTKQAIDFTRTYSGFSG